MLVFDRSHLIMLIRFLPAQNFFVVRLALQFAERNCTRLAQIGHRRSFPSPGPGPPLRSRIVRSLVLIFPKSGLRRIRLYLRRLLLDRLYRSQDC